MDISHGALALAGIGQDVLLVHRHEAYSTHFLLWLSIRIGETSFLLLNSFLHFWYLQMGGDMGNREIFVLFKVLVR